MYTVAYGTTGSAGTYAAQDQAGGTLVFSGVNWRNTSGELRSVSVTLLSGGSLPLSLFVFNGAPTLAADNAPFSAAAADLTAHLVGVINFVAADYTAGGGAVSVATKNGLKLPYTTSDAGNLYAAVELRSAGTLTGADHVSVAIGLERD